MDKFAYEMEADRRKPGFQDAIKSPIMATVATAWTAPEPQEREINMKSRNFSLTAAIVFAIVALVQLARAVFGWPLTVDAYAVPLWLIALARKPVVLANTPIAHGRTYQLEAPKHA